MTHKGMGGLQMDADRKKKGISCAEDAETAAKTPIFLRVLCGSARGIPNFFVYEMLGGRSIAQTCTPSRGVLLCSITWKPCFW